jgi:hypothetical protein
MSATVVSGPRNLITDVAGLAVGNAHSEQFATGVTVLLPDAPCVAAVDIRGGAPGTRDIAALDPASLVQNVDAIVLSGGSVFGLEAAGGVTASLSAKGRGITFGKQPWPTPVVPAAILFDLMFGPDKQWGDVPPYRQLGLDALEAASADFALGNQGAGYGATTGTVKGGLGSASAMFAGFTVGALVAANPVGACIDPRSGDLWARPFELDGEFGPAPTPPSGEQRLGLRHLHQHPSFITPTRSHIWRTTGRSWEMNSIVRFRCSCKSFRMFRICAWIDTSRHSSARRRSGTWLRRKRARDGNALPLPAGELVRIFQPRLRAEADPVEQLGTRARSASPDRMP